MKALYELSAPAKLNLFLHVTGQRDDDYHLLQSLFMLIDWCDTLHIELRNDGELSREDLGPALPPEDLVLRAARALKAYAASDQGAHIGVMKRIPSEAGLGGGSSDAATCLIALNRLWKLNLPLATLERIGLSLGADVPFFLRGRNAWVEGIGEQITPVDLPSARFAVLKPSRGLATSKIFSSPDLQRSTPAAILLGFAAYDAAQSRFISDEIFSFGRNDLQPVAQMLNPEVNEAIQWFNNQGFDARMTGSGSSVFARMNLPQEMLLHNLPSDWQLRICSNLAAHPLLDWVG